MLFHAIAQSSGVFVLPLSIPSRGWCLCCHFARRAARHGTGITARHFKSTQHFKISSAHRAKNTASHSLARGAWTALRLEAAQPKPHGAASGNPVSCQSRALHARPGSHLAGVWPCCPLGLSDVWCRSQLCCPALGTQRLAAPDWGKVTTCFC